jgi:Co/Zn/Cd efflux system component
MHLAAEHDDDHHEHPNDDHHNHGGWMARAAHEVSEFFGGHSHAAAEQIDDALEAHSAGRRALFIGFGGLGLTAAIQAVVVVLSGSVALLGDAMHNVADAEFARPAAGRRKVAVRS